jgi:hypothetical protein
MTRTSIIFLFLFLFLQKCYGQEFTISLTSSDSAILRGDYVLAIEMLQRTIQMDTDNFEIDRAKYNICCVFALRGMKDSAFNSIAKYLMDRPDIHLFNEPDFYLLTHDRRWKTLYNKLSKQYFEEHPTYNKEKSYQLSLMRINDQAYYKKMEVAKTKYGPQSKEVKQIWKTKDSLNQINIIQLLKMSPNGDFPKSSEIGREGNQTLFLIIQHSNLEIQKKYLPAVEKLANDNEIAKQAFALLKDRVCVGEGQDQIYGSQVKTDSAGIYTLVPIRDEIHVNERRKEMGMIPLEDYLKRYNIVHHLPEK